jgi:hypothetical protein
LDGRKRPFLTHHFTSLGVNALPFAIAIIDLPLTSANSRQQHKFKSDKKRGIVITAGSNLVIFKKEIKEGEQKLKNDSLKSISKRRFSMKKPTSPCAKP